MSDIVAVSKGEGTHLAHTHTLDDRTIYLTLCGNDLTGATTVDDAEVDCRRCRTSGATEYRNTLAKLSDTRREEAALSESLDRLTRYLGLGSQNVQARSGEGSATRADTRKGAA